MSYTPLETLTHTNNPYGYLQNSVALPVKQECPDLPLPNGYPDYSNPHPFPVQGQWNHYPAPYYPSYDNMYGFYDPYAFAPIPGAVRVDEGREEDVKPIVEEPFVSLEEQKLLESPVRKLRKRKRTESEEDRRPVKAYRRNRYSRRGIKDAEGNIDTTLLTLELREEMERLGVGQTLFAREVLHRSQGTFCDLLKRPKPWHILSPKGKLAFEAMYDWLSLSSDEDKLSWVLPGR